MRSENESMERGCRETTMIPRFGLRENVDTAKLWPLLQMHNYLLEQEGLLICMLIPEGLRNVCMRSDSDAESERFTLQMILREQFLNSKTCRTAVVTTKPFHESDTSNDPIL